jgi:cell pole-organizing protein PopZ
MASNPQHEPTMEEILASIRKIISDDAPETPAADAQAPEAPAPEASFPAEESDVLELTQEVTAESEIKTENDVIFQTIEEPAPVTPPVEEVPAAPAEALQPEPVAAPQSNDIFSDTTRKAMDDAFAHIPDAVEPEPAPAPQPHAPVPLAPVDGSSVETVFERAVRESFEPVLKKYLTDNSAAVIEGMKPLIREWMDEHFPPLLEGAVRAEVERVVKARGAKR